jgi:hypothetical protein
MAGVGDLLQVKHEFSLGSVLAYIIYFLEIDNIETGDLILPIAAQSIHEKFDAEVWQSMGASQALLRRTIIDNITDGLEYGEFEDHVNGGQVGDRLPPFVALSVKQVGATRATRAGFKRLPFGTETDNDAGNWIGDAGAETAITDYFKLITIFDIPLSPGSPLFNGQNVIVGRVETFPDSGIYVLNPSVRNLVVDANIQKWTHQISRDS